MKLAVRFLALLTMMGAFSTRAVVNCDAIEQTVRDSDPEALRSLLIPGLDLTHNKKIELTVLAKQITNTTFMNLNRASVADGWRCLRGIAKFATGVLSGIMAYGLFTGGIRLIDPLQLKKIETTEGVESSSASSPIPESEKVFSDSDRALNYLVTIVPSLESYLSSPGRNSTEAGFGGTRKEGEVKTVLSHNYLLENTANPGERLVYCSAVGLAVYFFYTGIADIHGWISRRARYNHHQRALAVEAIIQRIPACAEPPCERNFIDQSVDE